MKQHPEVLSEMALLIEKARQKFTLEQKDWAGIFIFFMSYVQEDY
jgi:hypothetical protein